MYASFFQAFIEMVAELHLLIAMRRIEEVRFIINLTMGLPLLPEEYVVRGYRVILQHALNEGACLPNCETLSHICLAQLGKPAMAKGKDGRAQLQAKNQ